MRLLASYNEKTNGEMNKLISHMDEAQWNHSFNAFFPNIRKVCNHIYAADFHWLRRFSGLRSFQYIQDKVFLKTVDFATDTFETQKEYLPKREYMDKLIVDFVHEVTQADLGRSLVYTDIRGNEHHRDFAGLVLHMFNHETHHRGMISVYLEMLGIQNDYSNLSNLIQDNS